MASAAAPDPGGEPAGSLPERLGDYRILRRMGAASERYLARHGKRRRVVIERVAAPGASVEEVRAELQRYRRLRHAALEKLEEHRFDSGAVLLVFERFDGVALDRLKGYLFRDRERMPDAAVWFIGWRLMGALSKGHLARDGKTLAPIVHGNLTAGQVLVSLAGEVCVSGLCPFSSGAAGEAHDEARSRYFAPELRGGPEGRRPEVGPTVKSDAYGAAVLIWSLLTGRRPPRDAPPPALSELRPDVPLDVSRSLDRALGPEPSERPSLAELAQQLEGLARESGGQHALRDCAELYQALWGLWTEATPPPPASVLVESLLSTDIDPTAEPDEASPAAPAEPPAVEPSGEDEPGEDGPSSADAVPAEPTDEEPEAATKEPPPLPPEPAAPPTPPVAENARATAGLAPAMESRAPAVQEAPPPAAPHVPRVEEPDALRSDAPTARSSGRQARADGPRRLWRWPAFAALALLAAAFAWHRRDRAETHDPAPAGSLAAAAVRPATAAASSATRPAGAELEPGPDADSGGAKLIASATVAPGPAVPREPKMFVRTSKEGIREGELYLYEAYLEVRTGVNAEVYLLGVRAGRTNERIKTHCLRPIWLRLGDSPGPRWLTEGFSLMKVECGALTVVTFEPDVTRESP